jgi:hypothetical protein
MACRDAPGKMAEYVEKRLKAGATEITNAEVYTAVGIDKRHFPALISKEVWRDWTEARNLWPCKLGGHRSGLRLAA